MNKNLVTHRKLACLKKLPIVTTSLFLSLSFSSTADLLKGFGKDSEVVRQEKEHECIPSPPSPNPPAQHSGAEGLPPLPLPVVPLRRTEKKNPPQPPVLLTRLTTSEQKQWGDNFGNTDNLLRWMAAEMDLHFSSTRRNESEIPENPRKIPILYRTGVKSFQWDAKTRKDIRLYLEQGGTLILEARCGRWDFFESALREIQTIFPKRPPYRLNFDHPLYRSFFNILPENIDYRSHARKAGAQPGMPGAIGIDIGCRTAVFLFRWDVSSGWDGLGKERSPYCLGYTIESSRILGANLMAYATAERNASESLGRALEFVDPPGETQTGKFTVAQARYSGLWKTNQAAVPMILDKFHEQTRTPVSFARREVDLDSSRLFDFPLVYITGHHDFELSLSERRNLRRYLEQGGTLLAESCCGRKGFDKGIRRVISQIFDRSEFTELTPPHPLFSYPNDVRKAAPRPALARRLQTEKEIIPRLYGLYINNRLAIIYSPHDLSSGWEMAESPYCAGLLPGDAINLGVNILAYTLLQ